MSYHDNLFIVRTFMIRVQCNGIGMVSISKNVSTSTFTLTKRSNEVIFGAKLQ